MLTALALEELWVFDSVQSRMVFRKVAYAAGRCFDFDKALCSGAGALQDLRRDLGERGGQPAAGPGGHGRGEGGHRPRERRALGVE